MHDDYDSWVTLDGWDNLSLAHKESFISRSCTQLIVDMAKAHEDKGLDILHKNLTALADFIDSMRLEVEIQDAKRNILDSLQALSSDIENEKWDEHLLSNIEALEALVSHFLTFATTEELLDQQDEDVEDNLRKALSKQAV